MKRKKVNFSETIKDIEKLLISDYYKYREEWNDEEIIRSNGETKGKKLINAAKEEKKILALVKFKSMMIHNDRIVVSIKCPWYPWDDGGILLEEGGYLKIGNGDMMQYTGQKSKMNNLKSKFSSGFKKKG